ncbi:hypothetical protein HYU16_00930 [Candidatus Woesearchaeota archaeon]|nr:hypothetical protein [Candidatus Woesearchaeota archaeon]
MKRFSINPIVYDWIFWISVTVVVVWMVLKAAGIIQSPAWQVLLPYAGSLVAVVAYFQKTGRQLQKIDHLDRDFHEFRSKAELRFDEIKDGLHKHDNRLIRIEAKLA